MTDSEIQNLLFEFRSIRLKNFSDLYVILYLALLCKKKKAVGDLAFDRSVISGIKNEPLRKSIEKSIRGIGENGIMQVFRQINDKLFDAEQIKSVILANFGNSLGLKNELYYSTPPVISRLASAILDVKKNESFADFYSGMGEIIVSGDINTKDVTCYDINEEAILISMIKSEVKGMPAKFEIKDLLKIDTNKEKFAQFDKIYAEPPFGLKFESNDLSRLAYYTGMPIRERQSDWATVALAINSLNEGGKAVFVLPAGSAFNMRSQEIREFLIKNQLLSTIFEFPAGAYTYTGIKVLMYVIEKKPKNKVKMINLPKLESDASRLSSRNFLEKNLPNIIRAYESSEETEISKYVSYEEEILKDSCISLLPSSYFKEILKFSCKEYRLKDIVTIFKGVNVPTEMDEMSECSEETDYVLINISDIQDCVLTKKAYVNEFKTSVRSICTTKEGFGYLIVSRMFNHKKTCVLEEKPRKKIFSGANTFVFEFDKKVLDPYYLQYCFVHEEGKLFSNVPQGSALTLLTSKSFEDMSIPVPDMDIQTKIATSFKATIDKIKKAKEVLAQADDDLKTMNLFKGVIIK